MNTTMQSSASRLMEKLKASDRYRPIDTTNLCRNCGYPVAVCHCECKNCPTCNGSGYIMENPDAGISDKDFGKLKQCPDYARKVAATVKPDYKRIGMTELDMSLTWDHIKKDLSDGHKALQVVKPAYERGWGMVYVWGAWGNAKTLIGKILTAIAYRDGKTAAYANMLTVLDDIRLAFDSDEHKTTELIRRMDWWVGRDVLFLDELDKTNTTAWAQERLFELIDRRYQRAVRGEALTVIASNTSTAALDGYIKSRLNDGRVGTIVELQGKDARAVMPQEWKW